MPLTDSFCSSPAAIDLRLLTGRTCQEGSWFRSSPHLFDAHLPLLILLLTWSWAMRFAFHPLIHPLIHPFTTLPAIALHSMSLLWSGFTYLVVSSWLDLTFHEREAVLMNAANHQRGATGNWVPPVLHICTWVLFLCNHWSFFLGCEAFSSNK